MEAYVLKCMKFYTKRPRRMNWIFIFHMPKRKADFRAFVWIRSFFVPFMEKGLDISGMDLSREMLEKLKRKAPGAKVVQDDILTYATEEKFDYIFIPSGSVSLFTDLEMCKKVLIKLRSLLMPGGIFVFAVDTIANRNADNSDYKIDIAVKTKEGLDLILKSKNYYDEQSQTQFSPGRYELYKNNELLQSETMDFQTHLYRFGEMEQYLRECGFSEIITYSSFQKERATNDKCEIFLCECR